MDKVKFLTVVLGTTSIFVLGSLLHFAYEWADKHWITAIFAAVNESTWEHLKIAFWPGVLYAACLAYFSGRSIYTFWAGQGYGLVCVSIVIVVFFYGYVAIIGTNILALDISVFFIGILIGQLVGLYSFDFLERWRSLRWIGLGLLILQTLTFSLFTYWPPKATLFIDPRTEAYGIPS